MAKNIVITMAGRGSRFFEAGYTVPKYEIMAHGRSLFEWSMLSLNNFIDLDSRIIFICLAENKSFNYVKNYSDKLGLKNVHIVELDSVTDGQATSAYMSKELWQQDDSLLIYNIDTYVNPAMLKSEDIKHDSDGWIPCFQAPGDHWSFVELNENEWAKQVVEKKRISKYASIGLYWFARASDFLKAYEGFFLDSNSLVKGERYTAPLYSYLIRSGRKISITDLPVSEVYVLGTPVELQSFVDKSEI